MTYAVVVGILVLGWVGFRAQLTQNWNRAWSEVADRHGLELERATFFRRPSMGGRIHGMDVSVGTTSSSQGPNRTNWEVRHEPVGPRVVMRLDDRSRIFRIPGRGPDVVIGDPVFDERVIVRSEDVDGVRSFLTPVRRAAVLDLLSGWELASVSNDAVRVARDYVCTDAGELHGTLVRLIDTARVMAHPDEVDTILGHLHDGELARAAAELHEVNAAEPNVFVQGLEGGVLAEAGRHAEAAVVFDGLAEQVPHDTIVEGWQGVVHRAADATVRPESVATEGAAGAVVVGGVGVPVDVRQRVVLDDLFSADRMSWEIVEYFEGTYRGAVVEWSGTVTRANRYERDLDFGVGPGVKATVLLGHAGRSDLISNEVHAIVGLPAQERPDVGSEVRFRGVLTNVDRFSRKLWVQQAALVA